VAIELDLPDRIVDPRRCDCLICRRRGAIVASVPLGDIRIVQGEVPVNDGVNHPADRGASDAS
jgi:hypothetical protein